ncbi:MAG: D-aminoacyl-tRNA deacylase [Mariniblastus sp.]|nr:D-aminoacyl-tRNA deacylase [Mariniblastus sp.]
MRSVIQRVSRCSVRVANSMVGQIGSGLLILVGVEKGDSQEDLHYTADKLLGLRVFNDSDGKMNLSIQDTGGEILVVSQFTLLGDARRGRRPSFINAADPADGERLYRQMIEYLQQQGAAVQSGQFQADMQVELINDGPVTILIDSRKTF